MPRSSTPGNAEIKIMHNLITYQNISVYFSYKQKPEVDSCFPRLGPARGGTMVDIRGRYFTEDITCIFDDYLEIVPIRDSSERIICEMPPHYQTEAKSFNLRGSQVTIVTPCTYKYHQNIALNNIHPKSFYTSNVLPIIINIEGYGFSNEDPENNSLRIRVNEVETRNITFVNSTYLIAQIQNIPIQGSYTVFFSNNYGVDYTKATKRLNLKFNKLEIVNAVSYDKVQISREDYDYDRIDVDITVLGQGFPSDPNTPYYCAVGNTDVAPFEMRWTYAMILNSTAIICRNVSQFNSQLLPNATYLSLKFGFTTTDFAGVLSVLYYPKIQILSLNNHTFYQTLDRLVIGVHGKNFINTVRKLNCKLTDKIDNPYFASYIYFKSSEEIECIFDVEPRINNGSYNIHVANNNIQYVKYWRDIEILPTIKIKNMWPSVFLVNDQTEKQFNRLMYIEIEYTAYSQMQCYFMPTSELRAVLYQSPKRNLVVYAVQVNETFVSCQVPSDFSDLAPISIDVRIGYQHEPTSSSQSSFQIHILDRCPPGYYCTDSLNQCPVGHYCPGNSLYSFPIPCQIGYFQPKIRSQKCLPCIRGHFCPQEGLINPVPCPVGIICDIQKLSSPRAECPPGSYCPIPSNQGDKSYQNGFFLNLTQKCNIGTYCRGGLAIPNVTEPKNYESVVTECLQGMICHQGSYLTDGVGECPSGYFCPHRNHTGIACPPRYYCPGRGNIEPQKCPRGTFNMHFGQQNCTNCTLGRICPVEGMVMPILCPSGYVCNGESLIIPENVCRIGHVCTGEVMSGLLTSQMSCQSLIVIDNKILCNSGIFYQHFKNRIKTVASLYSDDYKLDEYFQKGDLCCWNQTTTFSWLKNIGEAINQRHTFEIYTTQLRDQMKILNFSNNSDISVPRWDGYLIVERFLAGQSFNSTDGFYTIDDRHDQIVQYFIQKMYTKYLANFCLPGNLCLEAVNTFEKDGYLISSPFPCPSGSYCLRGAQSVIGSGLCPIGYFCPAQTAQPQLAPAGSFTGNLGSVDSSQCSPGTFTLELKSSECSACPSGFECKERGTITPRVCQVGYYRSATESNICSMCPKGTFSFERSAKDYLECLECPAGRICEVEGLTNITQTTACVDGRVCFSGTGAKLQVDCPEGYYCPPETTGDTMYDNPCAKGFYCKTQTGNSTKYQNNCPQTYFCPLGTGVYNYTTSPTDYDNWEKDAPTRCPRGTGNDNTDTKKDILNCTINVEFKLMPTIDLRSLYPDPTTRTAPGTDGNRRLRQRDRKLRQLSHQRTHERKLAEVEVAGKDDPMLKDLWEIMFEVYRSYDTNNPPNSINTYLNKNRQYLYRVNPLNQSLCDEWYVQQNLTQRVALNAEGSKQFKLKPNNYMLISMDFRHVLEEQYNWVYGEDWEVSFTVSTDEFEIDATADSILMAEQFLNFQTSKSQLLEFEILAWAEIYIRIDILIYNALYINHKYAFINSTSIEIRQPERAVMNTDKIFVISLDSQSLIMLPYNQPPIQTSVTDYPKYVLSFAKYWGSVADDFQPVIQQSTKNRNIWIPASLYWNQRPTINLAYLPYFSNCNGYGQHIPLWSLIEQNSACVQVELDKTLYMTEFSFGQSPTADNCPAITINCIYDESPSDQQPLPRWFEIDGGTALFQVVVDPVDYETMMTTQFDQFQSLSAAPENGGGDPGYVPQQYDFILSYYQKGLVEKKIIIVELDYGDPVELTEGQYNGTEPIPYSLIFSFVPLSHKDLTIMFAFKSYFYIVLYILIGMLSIINMALFALYHRIMARPDKGQFAPFRFFSYFKLTIPPSFTGVCLALFPIIIKDALIALFITGGILTFNSQIFTCESTTDSECVYTLFDLIKDEPAKISVNYTGLRNGRCGIALLISGAYLMYVGLTVLIPDTTRLGRVQEAYNGNIWNYYQWKRSNMVFMSLWTIIYSLVVVQFSFSSIFSDNMYTMIIGMKLIGIGLDKATEKALSESLLCIPLSVTSTTVQGLVTFGSPDFLAFIQSYFIDFGITLFERCYLEGISSFIFEIIEVKIPKLLGEFTAWLNNEVQEEVVDEVQNLFGKKARNEDSETSDSRVMLSDDNSIQEQKGDESDRERDQNILFQTEILKENSSEDYATQFKPAQKSLSSFNQSSGASKFNFDYDSESISISSGIQSEETSDEEDETIEDEVNEEEVEPLIEEYTGYASDNVYLFFSPYFVLLLWVFYEQTQVAEQYGLKSADFVYYFLFQVVIVPFSIVVDIIQLNLTEWYHHKPMHDYLDYLKFRFQMRKSRWKGNEAFVNNKLEKGLQSLDKLCFSSQFYFVVTIYVCGMSEVILGIQTLLWVEGYNMFGDFCAIPLITWIVIVCVTIQQLAYKAGRYFNIWRIDPNIEQNEDVGGDLDKDFYNLLIRISDFQREEDLIQEEQIPNHLKFKLKAWNQLDRYKIQIMQLNADLQTDRIMADQYKEMFLQFNKPWLRDNVQEILTPRILFAQRKKIIQQLEKVLGPKQIDVELSEEKKEETLSSVQDEEQQENYLNKQMKKRMERLAKRFGIGGQQITKQIADQKVTAVSRMVIKYWITRMRMIRKLRVYVQSIVTLNIESECLYCRYTYGLHVEVLQSIEDMFYDFLQTTKSTINNYEHEEWTKYFRKRARYRTVCNECQDLIEKRYYMMQKKTRLASALPEDDDDLQVIMMSNKDQKARIAYIQGLSQRAKFCISQWLMLARYSLNPNLIPEQFSETPEEGGESEIEEDGLDLSENSLQRQGDESSSQQNDLFDKDFDQTSDLLQMEVQDQSSELSMFGSYSKDEKAQKIEELESFASSSSGYQSLDDIISDPEAQPSSILESSLDITELEQEERKGKNLSEDLGEIMEDPNQEESSLLKESLQFPLQTPTESADQDFSLNFN